MLAALERLRGRPRDRGHRADLEAAVADASPARSWSAARTARQAGRRQLPGRRSRRQRRRRGDRRRRRSKTRRGSRWRWPAAARAGTDASHATDEAPARAGRRRRAAAHGWRRASARSAGSTAAARWRARPGSAPGDAVLGASDRGVHAILDLGDDEYTVGRPHPMIDLAPAQRAHRGAPPPTRRPPSILLDVVLGYGATPIRPARSRPRSRRARAGRRADGPPARWSSPRCAGPTPIRRACVAQEARLRAAGVLLAPQQRPAPRRSRRGSLAARTPARAGRRGAHAVSAGRQRSRRASFVPAASAPSTSGSPMFAEPLARPRRAPSSQLDWRPPGRGRSRARPAARPPGGRPGRPVGARVAAANADGGRAAPRRPPDARRRPAGAARRSRASAAGTLLHAGPPIEWAAHVRPGAGRRHRRHPVRGLGVDRRGGRARSSTSGGIDLRAVPRPRRGRARWPASSRPSMPVVVVENAAAGNRALRDAQRGARQGPPLRRLRRVGARSPALVRRRRSGRRSRARAAGRRPVDLQQPHRPRRSRWATRATTGTSPRPRCSRGRSPRRWCGRSTAPTAAAVLDFLARQRPLLPEPLDGRLQGRPRRARTASRARRS